MSQRIDGDAGAKIEIALAVASLSAIRLRPARRRGRHVRKSASDARSRCKPSLPRRSKTNRAAETKCAASPGGTDQHFISAPSFRSTRENPRRLTLIYAISSTCGQENVERVARTLAPRLPPYCSILIVKYDISCGGQSSEALVIECVLGGYALPGAMGDFSKALPARLRRNQSMSWTDERVSGPTRSIKNKERPRALCTGRKSVSKVFGLKQVNGNTAG